MVSFRQFAKVLSVSTISVTVNRHGDGNQMITNSTGVECRFAVDLAPVEEVDFVSGGKQVGSEQGAMSLYCAPRREPAYILLSF